MPSKPKNGLDLLRWLIFEPILLKRFSETLTKKESLYWFLRAYPWMTIVFLLGWIAAIFLVTVF